MTTNIDTDGWTEIVPEGDARTIHVAANGNDSKAGSSPSEAVRTIARGHYFVRDGHGDHLLLHGVDTFSEPFGGWIKSGESAQNPLVVTSYGGGRAKIRCPADVTPFHFAGGGGAPSRIRHLAVIGLDFEGASDRTGMEDVKAVELLRPAEDLLFEGCRFARFGTNLVFMDLDKTGSVTDIRLRRCQVLDSFHKSSHSQGLYMEGLSRFSAFECLFAHNGFDSPTADTGATVFRHGVYAQNGPASEASTFEGCVVSQGSATGLMLRAGGTVKACLFTDNPIALIVGGGDTPHAEGIPAQVSDCVILNGRDISPASADKRGWGMGFSNINRGRVTDNLIAHNHGGYAIAVLVDGDVGTFGVAGMTLERNIVHDWPGGLRKTGAPSRIRDFSDANNDWKRPASKCVDPTKTIPADYIQSLRGMHKGNWDKALWPLGGINREIMAGYAAK